VSVIEEQSDLKEAEDCDITTDFSESTKNNDWSDGRNIEGVVVVVVFEENSHGFVSKVRVLVHVVGCPCCELKVRVIIIIQLRDSDLPKI
jgi:hypothetical protein